MTKVSLQKQTKDLTAQAEAIKRKIDEANSLVKSQVIWLQDAEKNLKLKIKEQKLIKKQEELKNEAEEKAKAQEVQNLKTQEEENHKASEKTKEEKKEKENKQKKTELKNKNETLKDKSKKTEIKKEKTKTKEEKTEQKPVVKTEKEAIEDKVIKHKKSVVPIKKESNNTQSNIDKKKSKTKIINIDDKPKRQIGIRVVKKAPTAEEIAAERKERQLKKQKIQQARKTTQAVKPGDRRTSVAHQARPQKSVQKKYEKRDTDTKQNTSLPKGDSKLPVRPNTRKKTRPVARNMYQQTPNTATRQKKKTPSSTRESGKKYVFGDVYSPTGSRRKGPRRNTNKKNIEKILIENAVITTKTITIKELSEKIGKPGADIIKQLFLLGIMANINQSIDFDTAALVALELGITLEHNVEKTNEEKMVAAHDDLIDDENIIKRAPIVTVMGHVDHGKTSLLDAIRKTNVIQGEAGGITQHIGAYSINYKGEDITFIDTPGHEAFTAMRARGAQVTDIAVLVVAADDGVMPQTVEAINHAKAANVPIIVAINKMDVPGANPERVKQELTEHELLTEDWGGTTIMVELSALENEGIDKLLENIILVAEIQELKANPNASAKGTIIEAQLDTGRGPVATVLIQNGTLKIGDSIVAGTISGKVRAMIDDKGNKVEKAGPSSPVEVLGFSSVPAASDIMYAAGDKLSRKVAADRKSQIREDQTKSSQMVTLDDLFNKIKEGKLKDLNIVIKADVQGSVEAMKQSLIKLTNEEVRVTIKHSGVGAISESDVRLASASNAIIIGFNVRPDANGRAIAAEENVEIRTYRIIYNAIEDIEKAIKGMLKPIYTEAVQGHAEVRNVIKVTSIGNIAGSYITDGVFTRNSSARLLRDSVIIYEGKLLSLRRFKDDVKEVRQGFECGITLDNFNDIKEGDVIEAFIMKEVKR